MYISGLENNINTDQKCEWKLQSFTNTGIPNDVGLCTKNQKENCDNVPNCNYIVIKNIDSLQNYHITLTFLTDNINKSFDIFSGIYNTILYIFRNF